MADGRPRFWIVAGPNGSGKSTLYGETRIDEFSKSIWIINPDLLTKRIQLVEHLEYMQANSAALDRIMDWLKSSLRAHQTVGVETVLSTDKYRAIVGLAQQYGHEVCLVYVYLATPQLNIDRVALRVAKGGHDVNAAKITERRTKSFDQLPWFAEQADRVWIWDNSGEEPVEVGRKEFGKFTVSEEILPAIKTKLQHLLG